MGKGEFQIEVLRQDQGFTLLRVVDINKNIEMDIEYYAPLIMEMVKGPKKGITEWYLIRLATIVTEEMEKYETFCG